MSDINTVGQGIYVELDADGVTLTVAEVNEETGMEMTGEELQLPWPAYLYVQQQVNSWMWQQVQAAMQVTRHTTIFRTGYTDVDGDQIYEWFGNRAEAAERQAELDEAREEIRNHPSGDLTPGVMVCTIEMFVLPTDKAKLVDWLNGQRLNW